MLRYVKPPYKRAPIELDPSPDGNVLAHGTTYEILTKEKLVEAREKGWPLRKNHFATCRFAKRFADRQRSAVA